MIPRHLSGSSIQLSFSDSTFTERRAQRRRYIELEGGDLKWLAARCMRSAKARATQTARKSRPEQPSHGVSPPNSSVPQRRDHRLAQTDQVADCRVCDGGWARPDQEEKGLLRPAAGRFGLQKPGSLHDGQVCLGRSEHQGIGGSTDLRRRSCPGFAPRWATSWPQRVCQVSQRTSSDSAFELDLRRRAHPH